MGTGDLGLINNFILQKLFTGEAYSQGLHMGQPSMIGSLNLGENDTKRGV